MSFAHAHCCLLGGFSQRFYEGGALIPTQSSTTSSPPPAAMYPTRTLSVIAWSCPKPQPHSHRRICRPTTSPRRGIFSPRRPWLHLGSPYRLRVVATCPIPDASHVALSRSVFSRSRTAFIFSWLTSLSCQWMKHEDLGHSAPVSIPS